ncbi:TonB family protein [Lysobacter sp. CCNWLW3]|uniref:energy transducer TonB n=1 Tax=unclassified Lysobacter TaxID=2635362 RepID=UPI002FD623A1
MSTPSPAPSRPVLDLSAWRPSRKALWWVLGAFALGLILFALVWSRSDDHDFYRADEVAPPTAAGPNYAPLPAPMSGNEGSGVGPAPQSAPAAGADQPRLVETAPPPPPADAAVAARPQTPPPAAVASSDPQPIAGQNPAPRYPPQALRRGESGTVTVRVQIGADGVPTDVGVGTSSGSRTLDRAAQDAVRRWRFRPALANGQPVSGTVMVPITFDASR